MTFAPPEGAMAAGMLRLMPGDPLYPDLLASIPDPPRPLYVRGNLGNVPAVAIVGSRRPTPYGLRTARRLAREAVAAGLATVSGLARGIDTQVHRATLEAGGVTWAVLGSGLDRPYPPENAGLAAEIARRGGAVASEVPPSGPPLAANFPRRNRIISGLAWATVVVEGRANSGALITAKAALEQGREALAVPGPVDSPLSEGPLRLLKDGAPPVCCIEDVLEAADRLRTVFAPKQEAPKQEALDKNEANPYLYRAQNGRFVDGAGNEALSMEERTVLERIGSESVSLEELLREEGPGVDRLSALLMELELRGLLRSFPGQRYARA